MILNSKLLIEETNVTNNKSIAESVPIIHRNTLKCRDTNVAEAAI